MPIPIPGRVGEALRRSTAAVRSKGRSAEGTGSAVVLHDDLVVTNAHVIRGREVEVESWDGKRVRAEILKLDRARDLALLAAKKLGANPAQLGDSDALRAGVPVIAIGNPLGFTGAMSSGVVHATAVTAAVSARLGAQRWLCADVRLAPGNSGGPLADLEGRVVGINTMVISGGLALAVPSRSVQWFVSARKEQPGIGLTVRAVELSGNKYGLLILELTAGGAAERASLLPGDVILSANDRLLPFAEDLPLAAQGTDILPLEFVRGGEARVRRVVLRLGEERASTAA